MKKLLCIVLSLVIALSVCVTAFAADTGEDKDLAQTLSEKTISDEFINALMSQEQDLASIPFGADINTNWITSGQLYGISFFGLDLGYLYSREEHILPWSGGFSKGDMASFWGELNTYMVYYLKDAYTNYDRLCTSKHATAICNFIGPLLDPEFSNKTINFGSDFVVKKTFYKRISDESGLTQAIIDGWLRKDAQGNYVIKPTMNYTPLMKILDIPLFGNNGSGASDEIFEYFDVPSEEYRIPSELGGFIIKSVIENAINDGPIQYLLNVLRSFVKTYSIDVASPVLALFNKKMTDGSPTREELNSFDVFFNMVANDNNPNSSRLQFCKFPAYQFSKAADNTEAFLYLMAYTNLVGRNGNNKARINKWVTAISKTDELRKQMWRDDTCSIVKAMFLGNFTEIATKIRSMSEENLNHVAGVWGWNFGDFFARLYRSIALFFDGIFRTLKNGINLDIFG